MEKTKLVELLTSTQLTYQEELKQLRLDFSSTSYNLLDKKSIMNRIIIAHEVVEICTDCLKYLQDLKDNEIDIVLDFLLHLYRCVINNCYTHDYNIKLVYNVKSLNIVFDHLNLTLSLIEKNGNKTNN